MEKKVAEEEKKKHVNLLRKVLTHKKYHKKMQVVGMEIHETSPKSNLFFVSCKLKGELGEVEETLEYVLTNYSIHKTA